jgi:thiol-disulfide isomerase/thioredoxin
MVTTGLKTYRRGVSGPAVLFVKADWCGYCKAAKPEMRRAAATLGTVLPVYEIDADRQKDIVATMPVSGFPTIFFLTAAGQLRKYEGERQGQKVADWACAQSGACGRRR